MHELKRLYSYNCIISDSQHSKNEILLLYHFAPIYIKNQIIFNSIWNCGL